MVSFPEARTPVELPSSLISEDGRVEGVEEEESLALAARPEGSDESRWAVREGAPAAYPPPPR